MGSLKEKHLLFSVTKKDLIRQTFCTGGPGGQHKNATQNGVRFTHPPSKAVGTGVEDRDQHKNERSAFRNMLNTPEFKSWHTAECARRMGQLVVETPEQILARVDKMIEDGLKNGDLVVECL